jgi:hypothetical protein
MPRRHKNATRGGNAHSRSGGGWMKGKKRKAKGGAPRSDNAPLTSGQMHSRTRLR